MKEFYIGYLPKMPQSYKKLVRPLVIGVVVLGLVVSAVLALSQDEFANSLFEFGDVREFTGTIQARPVPFLLVSTDQKTSDGLPKIERYPLVGVGKSGVSQEVTDNSGKQVALKGQRIIRDGFRMIEVVDGSTRRLSDTHLDLNTEVKELGTKTLRGEIVDSKCYLGVMNPGNSKVHRECAVACLRGGVPALFIVKDDDGNRSELWLVSTEGKSINDEILDYVAEPVELTGRVVQEGDQLYFYVNPAAITRL